MEFSRRQRIVEEVASLVHVYIGNELAIQIDAAPAAFGASLEEADLGPLSGALRWEPAGARIFTNRSEHAAKQRFTIGHELAHLVLGSAHLVGALGLDIDEVAPQEEEKLCDEISAEILMPTSRVSTAARGSLTLQGIAELARKAQVSHTAAAARLIEVGRKNAIYVVWKQTEHDWTVVNAMGVPRPSPAILMTLSTAEMLDGLRDNYVDSRTLELQIGPSHRYWVDTNVVRHGKYLKMVAYDIAHVVRACAPYAGNDVDRDRPVGVNNFEMATKRRVRREWQCVPSYGSS